MGFLHTSPVHVATFDELVRRRLPEARTSHVVDAALLVTARARRPEAVSDEVRRRLDELKTSGAELICTTCSTIGDVAESTDSEVPVFRVDRPMARRAVNLGTRIGVVAALESTLEPTVALIDDEARRAGSDVSLDLRTADRAWARFESGDQQGYLAEVADATRALASRVEVIVLAQASMAGAESLLKDLDVPVLSSPRLAAEYLATELCCQTRG